MVVVWVWALGLLGAASPLPWRGRGSEMGQASWRACRVCACRRGIGELMVVFPLQRM